ncbi:UNVERIFIED_CONTAM: Nicotinate-nucleotide pyrophosphorylase [carboxylating], chloroplastic [Sesamum radiatum]|uniref:nicotinate-nucleotide diphosphorylase (carboxylating) n=1 Tax=Sesamum radiatum TaxID=300843 RepID=A0AAW2V6X7_SESRA
MSATATRNVGIPAGSLVVKPPAHPTYDLKSVIQLALSEDAGDRGDVTCQATIPVEMEVEAHFLAKEDGIVAGIALAEMVFNEVDPSLKVEWYINDGDSVHKGLQFGKVHGRAHSIVVAERVVLNFMQRMSGIATLTKAMADAARPACILETRKTAPAGGTANALKAVDDYLEQNNLQMVETRTLEEVNQVLQYASTRKTALTRIMLDNMVVPLSNGDVDISMLKEAVGLIDGRFETEFTQLAAPSDLLTLFSAAKNHCESSIFHASGNVTLDTVNKIGQSGVTYISRYRYFDILCQCCYTYT